jgi:hypothetical protein
MSGIPATAGAKLFSAQVNRRLKVKLGNPLVSPKKLSIQKKPGDISKDTGADADWITEGTYIPFTYESTTRSQRVSFQRNLCLIAVHDPGGCV